MERGRTYIAAKGKDRIELRDFGSGEFKIPRVGFWNFAFRSKIPRVGF